MNESRRREELLTLAALVRAGSADEMRFRFEALKAVAGFTASDRQDLDRWTVLAKVEDVAGFRSDEAILDALQDMGVIRREDDRVSLVDTFTLAGVMGDERRGMDLNCSLSLVESLESDATKAPSGGGLLAAIDAVRQARRRVMEMWGLICEGHDRSVAGVSLPPTFWRWEQRGDGRILAPWGAKPSTYTVLDMHRILVHPLCVLPLAMLGLTVDAARDELDVATAMLEATVGKHMAPWDGGLVFYSPNDDDYPGAVHPVVPSNAALLLALALEKEAHARLDHRPRLPDRTAWVDGLVAFLLAQRNDDGSWGVHRFADRQSGIPTFTALTLRALAKAVESWPEMADTAQAALRLAPMLVENKLVAIETGRGTVTGVRAGFSAQGRYSPTETLDLIDAVVSPIVLDPPWPTDLVDRCVAAATTAAREWTVLDTGARENIYTVSFQAPYENGPAPASTSWEQPGHARTLVSLLSLLRSQSAIRPLRIEDMLSNAELREKIDTTIALILSAHRDGCWYDFNLPDCVFPSNMIYFIDAICEYVNSFLEWENINSIKSY